MRPDDHVVGMVVNGKARACPLVIGNAWHLINDELGGEPIVWMA